MLKYGGLRRGVGAILVVTMLPWVTGCHKQVPVSLAPAKAPIGTRVRLSAAQPMTVKVTRPGLTPELFMDIATVEGVLVMATRDSLRVRDPTLTHATGRRVQGYQEATLVASTGITASRAEVAKARTAALGGTVGIALAIGALFLFVVLRCQAHPNSGGC